MGKNSRHSRALARNLLGAALERSGTLAGTVADPEAMAAFLGQFRFCG